MDFFSLLGGGASGIAIGKEIFHFIKKHLKKSPINKSLKNDLFDIADKWATDTDVELTYIMHDGINTLGLPDEIENEIYDLGNSDNKEINDNIKKIFAKTIEKAEGFLDLIEKQIDGYESGLNLVSQLNKEKEVTIGQMDEDIGNLINGYETLCKMFGSNDEDINKGLETFSILRKFILKKIKELCDKFIGRF